LKTILDFGLGALLTVLALPMMAVLTLAIGVTAGRPICEYHPALGLRGVVFRSVRFRTGLLGTIRRRLGMFLPKEIVENPAISSKVGKFLYRTGLDKLPQLFDVLAGRMSLVGPRLVSPDETHDLRPWLSSLLMVKPGWVGPWAISGSRSRQEEVLMDLYYVRNWTIWLDLQVLFQAARRVLTAGSRRKP
jgi:lipopolysaccharide/colanic/teichoic acid biosynthesis glycosyltransferase